MLIINNHLQQERYRIIDQFGQDEKSVVYEAFDNALKTNVIIKEFLVNPKKVTTATQQESLKLTFAKEAKFLTELKHDALLHVHNYFSESDHQYLVLESVEGKDLSELIEKLKKPFTSANVMNWADQLLDALNYLHSQTSPIIYRDIKPENIKLTPTGKIKLLTANLIQSIDSKVNNAAPHKTLDSADLNYLPLEQIWDGLDPASQKVILNSYDEKSEKILEQPADAQSDIYALSATLYHLVTGQFPVDALTRSIDNLEGKSDPLLPPNKLNSNIPSEFSNILMKALEIKRENRFDSALDMRQALEPILKITRERELEARKKQEIATQETRLAEQKRLEQERQLVHQTKLEVEAKQKRLEQERQLVEEKKLEVETVRKRQEELLKQQLTEAEAQRLKAEQRAAEAEKLLFEKDTQTIINNDVLELDDTKLWENKPSAVSLKTEAEFAQIAENVDLPKTIQNNSKQQKASADDFAFLSAEMPQSNKGWQKIAIVVVFLIVFSGAGFGVWTVMFSKSTASNQTITNQNLSSNEIAKPEPTIQTTTTPPSVEQKPETSATPADSAPQNAFETSGKNAVVKTKPISTPIPTPVKKPAIAATKPTPNPKKTLTVDDIINN